ncbi:hypothetical protein EAO72_10380 [Streptomyces sp. or43]|nr:hypothetical protein EAO72_10380 [Streptomyces sp. or43]
MGAPAAGLFPAPSRNRGSAPDPAPQTPEGLKAPEGPGSMHAEEGRSGQISVRRPPATSTRRVVRTASSIRRSCVTSSSVPV